MEWEKEKTENLADTIGFYAVVGLIRLILERNYPKDIFANSPDKGARFTTKLHEAIAILDEAHA